MSGEVPRGQLYPHVLAAATMLAIEPVVGARYLSTAHWLRDFYAWPEERRLAWQQERLRTVLAHAASHVPFYRSLIDDRWAGDRSATVDTLSELPVVGKARMRTDMAAFLSKDWERMPRVDKRTGGTTGDPWRYPLDRRAWGQMYGAALHFWERTGYRYGERMVLLGSPPSLVPGGTSWKARLRLGVERRTVSSAGLGIDRVSSLGRAVRAGEARAALWYGYAGTVAAMADAVAVQKATVVPPRAIITTAEVLQPAWRQRIEEVFAAPLFDEYGCNDGGVLALSCRSGRFHLAENLSIIEVLDGGRPCPPGVEGDVTVTNLHARVLPFLRYQVGDRAVMGEGPCPCGQPGHTLERISGRQGDRIRLPNGIELSAISFGQVFKRTSHVRRWQVVQPDLRHLRVRLEVEPGFDTLEAETIERYVHERCGDDIRVELTTSEPIERSSGGKHKVVIRRFE